MATRLNVLERLFEGPLAHRLTAAASSMGITLYWHGHAGFVIQAGARRLIIDPYLSDTLAAKYKGTATPHQRIERPPNDPAELGRVDLVLVTNDRLIPMDAGELIEPCAPAHETLETDFEGNHRFLGYALIFGERAPAFQSSIPETRSRSQAR
jgi:hypothetical protein